jgi:hypothetical protein
MLPAGAFAADHHQSLLQLRLGEPGNERWRGIHACAREQGPGVAAGFRPAIAQRAFVAGQLLVEPEAGQGEPGQRVEPQQRGRDFGQQPPERVAAPQVGAFVGEDQTALFGIAAVEEIRWEQHQAAWCPQCGRSLRMQSQTPRIHRQTVAKHARQQFRWNRATTSAHADIGRCQPQQHWRATDCPQQ